MVIEVVKIRYIEFVHKLPYPIEEEINKEKFWSDYRRFKGKGQGETVAVIAFSNGEVVYRVHYTNADDLARSCVDFLIESSDRLHIDEIKVIRYYYLMPWSLQSQNKPKVDVWVDKMLR